MSNHKTNKLPENDRIKELIPIHEIAAMMETGDYSAEMLLQHLCAHWNRRDGWSPIETAPKDGTIIRTKHRDLKGVIESQWLGDVYGWAGWAIEPTHWQPLPAPPVNLPDMPR